MRCTKELFKYIKKTPTCWWWIGGCRGDNGYPVCRWKDRTIGVSRIIYRLYKGQIKLGNYICHKCDNPKCVNPEHLFSGTPRDNVIDMVNKGRANSKATPGSFKCGNKHKLIKIKVEQRKKIKFLYNTGLFSQKQLAYKYKVHQSTISLILNNKTVEDVNSAL